MVRRLEPSALVVFAPWAILIQRAEYAGCRFLKDLAKIIVLQIARLLFTERHAVLGLIRRVILIVEP